MSIPRHGAASTHEHLGLRTSCGRDVAAGRLTPGGTEQPARPGQP